VLKKYNLLEAAPDRVTGYLREGCQGNAEETPKTLANCHNYIIGDNRLALEAMVRKAEEAGFTPFIVTAEQKGEPTAAAWSRANELLSAKYAAYSAILIGGETTPKLPANAGKGGRNQHYAAASMLAMQQYPGKWVMASMGTDGSDFLVDVAGAMVDSHSLDRVRARGMDIKDYLDRYDSNTLLAKIGRSLIITGDTGTNVGDVIIYLLK
jgi:glycerate-2-kinase